MKCRFVHRFQRLIKETGKIQLLVFLQPQLLPKRSRVHLLLCRHFGDDHDLCPFGGASHIAQGTCRDEEIIGVQMSVSGEQDVHPSHRLPMLEGVVKKIDLWRNVLAVHQLNGLVAVLVHRDLKILELAEQLQGLVAYGLGGAVAGGQLESFRLASITPADNANRIGV